MNAPGESFIGFKMDRLIGCRNEEISEAAARLIDALNGFGRQHRAVPLRALADKVRASGYPTHGRIGNQIAAIEILGFFDSPAAASLIEDGLDVSPGGHHVYLLSLASNTRFPLLGQSERLASLVLRLLDRAASVGDEGVYRSICGVAFLALSSLSPNAAVGPAGKHLDGVQGMELTAVLEAVLASIRMLKHKESVSQEFRSAISRLFKTYRFGDEEELDNVPGILSRLLEIIGRVDGSLEAARPIVASHPLKSQILYLLLQSPLCFLPIEERVDWYSMGMKTMMDVGSGDDFFDILAAMSRDDCWASMSTELRRRLAGS